MRHILGTLVAGVAIILVTGCGSSSTTATDPASDPAGSPSSSPSAGQSRSPGPVSDAVVLPLISMVGAGGRPSTIAAPLNTPREIDRFVQQFPAPTTQQRLRSAIAAAPGGPGSDVVGQIVAVGCDRPPGVDVVVDPDGRVELVPHEVASPLPECLAAVTTIAIAVIPAA
jgi:hypothetical protein